MELVSEQSHVESHLACHVGSDEHLRLADVVRFGNIETEVFPLSAMRKGNQSSNHFFLFDGRRMGKETHVLLRHIEVNHVGGAVVGNLTQEHRQFRHFDIGAETLFTLYRPGHVQFIVGCLLREYRRPRIKATDGLPSQLTRAQVLEHHIQLGKRIDHHRAGKECRPQIPACAVLNVTDGKQHVHCPL